MPINVWCAITDIWWWNRAVCQGKTACKPYLMFDAGFFRVMYRNQTTRRKERCRWLYQNGHDNLACTWSRNPLRTFWRHRRGNKAHVFVIWEGCWTLSILDVFVNAVLESVCCIVNLPIYLREVCRLEGADNVHIRFHGIQFLQGCQTSFYDR